MPAIAQKQQHSAAVVAAPVSAINSSQSELTPANQFGSSSTIDDPRVPALPAKPRELPTEMQKIKKMEQIKQYLESNRLPVKIEQAINRVVTTDQMPDDCVGSFINHITPSLPTPILRSIEVTEGVDSRGQSTFSITVDCLYRMRNYKMARVVVPAMSIMLEDSYGLQSELPVPPVVGRASIAVPPVAERAQAQFKVTLDKLAPKLCEALNGQPLDVRELDARIEHLLNTTSKNRSISASLSTVANSGGSAVGTANQTAVNNAAVAAAAGSIAMQPVGPSAFDRLLVAGLSLAINQAANRLANGGLTDEVLAVERLLTKSSPGDPVYRPQAGGLAGNSSGIAVGISAGIGGAGNAIASSTAAAAAFPITTINGGGGCGVYFSFPLVFGNNRLAIRNVSLLVSMETPYKDLIQLMGAAQNLAGPMLHAKMTALAQQQLQQQQLNMAESIANLTQQPAGGGKQAAGGKKSVDVGAGAGTAKGGMKQAGQRPDSGNKKGGGSIGQGSTSTDPPGTVVQTASGAFQLPNDVSVKLQDLIGWLIETIVRAKETAKHTVKLLVNFGSEEHYDQTERKYTLHAEEEPLALDQYLALLKTWLTDKNNEAVAALVDPLIGSDCAQLLELLTAKPNLLLYTSNPQTPAGDMQNANSGNNVVNNNITQLSSVAEEGHPSVTTAVAPSPQIPHAGNKPIPPTGSKQSSQTVTAAGTAPGGSQAAQTTTATTTQKSVRTKEDPKSASAASNRPQKTPQTAASTIPESLVTEIKQYPPLTVSLPQLRTITALVAREMQEKQRNLFVDLPPASSATGLHFYCSLMHAFGARVFNLNCLSSLLIEGSELIFSLQELIRRQDNEKQNN